jgi:hypothetical protein
LVGGLIPALEKYRVEYGVGAGFIGLGRPATDHNAGGDNDEHERMASAAGGMMGSRHGHGIPGAQETVL